MTYQVSIGAVGLEAEITLARSTTCPLNTTGCYTACSNVFGQPGSNDVVTCSYGQLTNIKTKRPSPLLITLMFKVSITLMSTLFFYLNIHIVDYFNVDIVDYFNVDIVDYLNVDIVD